MASSTVRVQQHRLRKACCAWAPLKSRTGRRKQAKVLPRSFQRRRRREAKLAERTLRGLVQQMLRLRLIVKTTLSSASNVRRMLRVAHACRRLGGSPRTVCAVLLVDRPLRDARVSRVMLQCFERLRQQGLAEDKAGWQSIQTGIRKHRALGCRSAFWHGPTALCAARAVEGICKKSLIDLASQVVSGAGTHTDSVMSELTSWPGVGTYHAYDTMRALRAVLGIQFRQEGEAAERMSTNVSMMQSVMPLRDMVSLLQKHHRRNALPVHAGDAALVTCECKKGLTRLGLLIPQKKYSRDELRATLGSPQAARLLFALQACDPLTEADLTGSDRLEHQERAQLKQCLPPTNASWDQTPHYAVGSEYLVSRFLPSLRRRGWRPERPAVK